MTSAFDAAQAFDRVETDLFVGSIDPRWSIGSAVNGGFLISLVARQLSQRCQEFGHPDPLSISAYYLRAGHGGGAEVHTDVVRTGRSMTTAAARLVQGSGSERIRALATFTDFAALPQGSQHRRLEAPQIAKPEDCIGTELAPPDFLANAPFLAQFELRLDPGCVGWAVGDPSRRGLLQGWFRLPDGREPDPLLLLMVLDALPPVTFDFGVTGWVPTLELTAHIRALPAPGWLLVRHRTRHYTDGFLEEDAEIWDSTGALVAQSRQLARAPAEEHQRPLSPPSSTA